MAGNQLTGFDGRPGNMTDQDFYTDLALQESMRWIEAVTRKQFRYPQDPRRSLQDGILLCELLMALKPGCIKKVNRLPTPIAGLDNLTLFLNACHQDFGLQNCQLFDMHDLEDLRLRDSIESEEELLCETMKRLKNVVMTIFWLGKTVRSSYIGPKLDFNVFSNLVDVPMTPLSRSEQSIPAIAGGSDFFPYRTTSPVLLPPQHPSHQALAATDSADYQSSAGYDSLSGSSASQTRPTSLGSEPFDDEPSSRSVASAGTPVPDTRVNTTSGATSGGSTSRLQLTKSIIEDSRSPHGSSTAGGIETFSWVPAQQQNVPPTKLKSSPRSSTSTTTPPVVQRTASVQQSTSRSSTPYGDGGHVTGYNRPVQRQTSAPYSPHFPTQSSSPRQPLSPNVAPLSASSQKSKLSPSISPSSPLMTTHRVKQQQSHNKSGQQQQQPRSPAESDWEENLSNWKQRRQSQRQSVSDDVTATPPPTASDSYTTNNPILLVDSALKGVPTSDAGLEESVLAMFGFSRADYAAPVSKKSSEENLSVTVTNRVLNSPSVAPVEVKQHHTGDRWRLETQPHVEIGHEQRTNSRQNDESSFNSTANIRSTNNTVVAQTKMQTTVELNLWLEQLPWQVETLDFSLCGGLQCQQPICVDTVDLGGISDQCGLRAGDELVAVNEVPLAGHYLESVIAVLNRTIHEQPILLTVRRPSTAAAADTPSTNRPDRQSVTVNRHNFGSQSSDGRQSYDISRLETTNRTQSRQVVDVVCCEQPASEAPPQQSRPPVYTVDTPAQPLLTTVPATQQYSVVPQSDVPDYTSFFNVGRERFESMNKTSPDTQTTVVQSSSSGQGHKADVPLGNSSESTPPPELPSSAPPPLPTAPPPIHRMSTSPIAVEVGFCVDDEEGWTYIDEDCVGQSRSLQQISEEDALVDEQCYESETAPVHSTFPDEATIADREPVVEQVESSADVNFAVKPVSHDNVFTTAPQSDYKAHADAQKTVHEFDGQKSVSFRRENDVFTTEVNSNNNAGVTSHSQTQRHVTSANSVQQQHRSDRSSSTQQTSSLFSTEDSRQSRDKFATSQSPAVSQQHSTNQQPNDLPCEDANIHPPTESCFAINDNRQKTNADGDVSSRQPEASLKIARDVQAEKESWLRKQDENSRQQANKLEKTKNWKSAELVNSPSLNYSCSFDVNEKAARDMESSLAYYRPTVDEGQRQRLAFDLEAERMKMVRWNEEQEQLRKEKFDREQEELKARLLLQLEQAKELDEKLREQEEQRIALELAKQKDNEELAKKRQEELQEKMKKLGVMPLTRSERVADVADNGSAANSIASQPLATFHAETRKNQDYIDAKMVPVIIEPASSDDQGPADAEDTRGSIDCPGDGEEEGDLISTEVQLIRVQPEQGHYEIILTDSDRTSSESGAATPVQQRLLAVAEAPSPASSTTSTSTSSIAAEQWKQFRREVLEESKPRPCGWTWMEGQQDMTSEPSVQQQQYQQQQQQQQQPRTSSPQSVVKGGQSGHRSPNSSRAISGHSPRASTSSLIPSREFPTDGSSFSIPIEHETSSASAQRPASVGQSNRVAVRPAPSSPSAFELGSPTKPAPPPRGDSVKTVDVLRSCKSFEVQKMSKSTTCRQSTQEYYHSQSYSESSGAGQLSKSYETQFSVVGSTDGGPVSKTLEVSQSSLQPEAVAGSETDTSQRQAIDELYSYHHMLPDSQQQDTLSARCNPTSVTTLHNSHLRTHF